MEDALLDFRLEDILVAVSLKDFVDCLLDHFHQVGIVSQMATDDADFRVDDTLDVVDEYSQHIKILFNAGTDGFITCCQLGADTKYVEILESGALLYRPAQAVEIVGDRKHIIVFVTSAVVTPHIGEFPGREVMAVEDASVSDNDTADTGI